MGFFFKSCKVKRHFWSATLWAIILIYRREEVILFIILWSASIDHPLSYPLGSLIMYYGVNLLSHCVLLLSNNKYLLAVVKYCERCKEKGTVCAVVIDNKTGEFAIRCTCGYECTPHSVSYILITGREETFYWILSWVSKRFSH